MKQLLVLATIVGAIAALALGGRMELAFPDRLTGVIGQMAELGSYVRGLFHEQLVSRAHVSKSKIGAVRTAECY